MKKVLLRCARSCFFVAACASVVSSQTKPNILFIAVDDLRPQIFNAAIDHYNTKIMKTPNLDKLANSGMVFDRAYTQVPVCAATRLSVLTGARPYKTPGKNYGRFWAFDDHLDSLSPSGAPAGTNHPRDTSGNPAPTLPRIFKSNGYRTKAIGKIYHHEADDRSAWTNGAARSNGGIYTIATNHPPFEIGVNQPDTAYADGKHREMALAALRAMSKASQPFFLSVGFMKPHLPFNCPKKYWDLYKRSDIRLPQNYSWPKGAPKESLHNSHELRSYAVDLDTTTIHVTTDEFAISLMHGYYACVSYTDAMIGALLNELDSLKIRDKTIIILWGDHGWNLGDHNMWVKHVLYETTLRNPLYIAAPGKKNGLRSNALVEYADIYPTLCELAGIPLPDHLEGTSLQPLLNNPGLPWKGAVYSNYQKGRSVRTNRYRYSEFFNQNDGLLSRMLYDEQEDPMETVNIAGLPENRNLIDTLSKLLNDGWRRAVTGSMNSPVSFDVLPSGKIEYDPTKVQSGGGASGNRCLVRYRYNHGSNSVVFSLPASSRQYTLNIFDLSGARVLMSSITDAAEMSIGMDKVGTGVYFYQISSNDNFHAAGKMSIIRQQ